MNIISLRELDKKVDNLNCKVLSIEEMEDINDKKQEYMLAIEEMIETFDHMDTVNESLYRLETVVANDYALKKDNKLSAESLQLSIETFKVEAEILGYEIDNTTLSSESITDLEYSFEMLDGERKGIIDNAIKYIDNLYHRVMDLYQSFKSIYKLLTNYDVNNINKYRMELKDGVRKASDNYRGDEIVLNRELAIFYAMGNKFEVKNLIEHLSIPYKLIVKEKMYDDAFKYAYDNLVQSVDNEQDIPVSQESIKFLSTINIDKVQDFLNRKTKFGMLDRMLGRRFSIVTVYQDDEGADARNDYFTVPDGYWKNKVIKPFTLKESEELLEFGLKLSGMGVDIGKESKSLFKNTIYKDLRSNIFTQLVEFAFGIFSLKRVIRQRYIAGRFANGVYKTLLMQNKSHIEAGDLIAKIVKNMTTKK